MDEIEINVGPAGNPQIAALRIGGRCLCRDEHGTNHTVGRITAMRLDEGQVFATVTGKPEALALAARAQFWIEPDPET